jgi:hypothetical protein
MRSREAMAAATYEVDEILSGVADDDLWVSIGFSSELEPRDVLHVVCATSVDEQDRKLGHDTIYLERFDQAYSCYAGAERISAGGAGIEVVLTLQGARDLDLPTKVSFVCPAGLEGWPDALHMLGRMSAYECGRVVSIDGRAPESPSAGNG